MLRVERHAGRRPHHRERRIFQRHISLLSTGDQLFNLRPQADIHGEDRQTKVRASGEMRAFVINNQRFPFAFTITDFFDGVVVNIEHIVIQRIHLAGKFNAQNAITHIPQGGGR